MTLKEKFIEAFKSGKRFDIENAEQVADEFAIGFAEWLISSSILKTELPMNVKLKMYKNQKGL